jgi:hypothetical protein
MSEAFTKTCRGLTGLLGFAYAPPDVDTVEYFANAGLLYNGPLPNSPW